jgi:hypothetical protein
VNNTPRDYKTNDDLCATAIDVAIGHLGARVVELRSRRGALWLNAKCDWVWASERELVVLGAMLADEEAMVQMGHRNPREHSPMRRQMMWERRAAIVEISDAVEATL